MKLRVAIILVIGMLLPILAVRAAEPSTVQIQVVDESGAPVRDAVVDLNPAGGWKGAAIRLTARPAMAQRDLQFVPGVLVVGQGSTVAFPNLDRVRHSIYSFSKAARFEFDLYGRDQTRSQVLPVSGTVALGCNIHDQMRGYIRVVNTPYAGKTDQNGVLTIPSVIGGSFAMTVWHPRLRLPNGELHRNVTIAGARQSIAVRVPLR